MFDLEKKLKFYEDQDFMAIEFKWRSPMSYFFLFFTIIWNAFLLFWYSMAFAGGAPWIFILFPMLHVAVGLGLIYFTTCQFLNKTNIEIDGNYLSIRHSPVPWWRGNIEIATETIDQLYVKETKSQGKNGTNYSYALRAKLIDNSDKEILSVTGVETAQMQEIEENLERFIGIVDRPVKGEYQSNPKASAAVEPRRQRRDFTNSLLGTFYFSNKGNAFDLQEEEVKVLSTTQYDWNDGNTDKLFQLVNENGEERLLYFYQNRAILTAYLEETLSLAAASEIDFKIKKPPKRIAFNGVDYQLTSYETGKKFILGGAQDIAIKQWVYTSPDKSSNIRVIDNNGAIVYYTGEKLSLSDFEDSLDLNAPPEKDIRYDERSWEDEDLV